MDTGSGMGKGDESAHPSSTSSAATAAEYVTNVRGDTLALAGQRMVIDIEIAHPCSAPASESDGDAGTKGRGKGKGWTVNSLRVERVDPEHLHLPSTAEAGVDGMDVDPSPLLSAAMDVAAPGDAIPGTRLLETQSLVLEHYLQKYLDAVNNYNEAERQWNTYHETFRPDLDEGDEESLELQAERAVLAFGDQLADLRGIDLKMQPLDALLGDTTAMTDSNTLVGGTTRMDGDVDMDKKEEKVAQGDQVILWDQLNEIHSLIK